MVIVIKYEKLDYDGYRCERDVIGDDLEYLEKEHWRDIIFDEIKRKFEDEVK